jgi:hypothetical protein
LTSTLLIAASRPKTPDVNSPNKKRLAKKVSGWQEMRFKSGKISDKMRKPSNPGILVKAAG